MVSEIRIYVEGGGDGKEGKAAIRWGVGQFLDQVRRIARQNHIKWQVIACGAQNDTYKNFKNALNDHPDAFNILLVDSEGPVSDMPRQHLRLNHKWQIVEVDDAHCHLMVQAMEAWLMADQKALQKFYGQSFNLNPLPKNQNVEKISKDSLEPALKAATKNTSKGQYHKIRHAPKILAKLDVSIVRSAAAHCNRLFETLITKLNED